MIPNRKLRDFFFDVAEQAGIALLKHASWPGRIRDIDNVKMCCADLDECILPRRGDFDLLDGLPRDFVTTEESEISGSRVLPNG